MVTFKDISRSTGRQPVNAHTADDRIVRRRKQVVAAEATLGRQLRAGECVTWLSEFQPIICTREYASTVRRNMRLRAGRRPEYLTVGRKRVHVDVAERALGKSLPAGAEVHHVDGNKLNNTNSNLVICQDHAYHGLLHVRARVLRLGGNPNTERTCADCKRLVLITEFPRNSNQCRPCIAQRVAALRSSRMEPE